jgi:hypothetical protein
MDIVAQAPSKRTRKCSSCTTLPHRALSRVSDDLQLWLGLTGVSLVHPAVQQIDEAGCLFIGSSISSPLLLPRQQGQ